MLLVLESVLNSKLSNMQSKLKIFKHSLIEIKTEFYLRCLKSAYIEYLLIYFITHFSGKALGCLSFTHSSIRMKWMNELYVILKKWSAWCHVTDQSSFKVVSTNLTNSRRWKIFCDIFYFYPNTSPKPFIKIWIWPPWISCNWYFFISY